MPDFRKLIFVFFCVLLFIYSSFAQSAFIRFNQIGYLNSDEKKANAFSKNPLSDQFLLIDVSTQKEVLRGNLKDISAENWGVDFPYYYELDFSAVKQTGKYFLKLEKSKTTSREFEIGNYPNYQDDLLSFMRQQRCGYNPYLDMVCHKRDGRTFYAPIPDKSFIDASGGWHDAGDQLKYLITASNATARMMLAYELEKSKFIDEVDDYGRNQPNGIPDVLDEAKWGLDWILKLHPKSDWLFHQVADDRDHKGFKMPDNDNADYGWGENSYRPVYFADGKPQGLREFKSKSTGVANIAGRSAAAMAMAYRIWKSDLKNNSQADQYLQNALELYEMGKRQEGFQQGNSFGAPYRYNEDTWVDDMEWAAAELFKATGKKNFLDDAKRYAKIIGATSWMQHDTAEHYQFYPFTNVGHFTLYPLVDKKTKQELSNYYREGIEKIIQRGNGNSYGVGVPFLWCSNNLVVAFITQVLLYEKMTGDMQFHLSMLSHRDWLFGRNPWGTSMFEGIPEGGEYPEDTHLPTVQLLKRQVPGGLVDGPILAETYKNLRGLVLTQPDEFAMFQPKGIVYHDDVGDYSTNEPTMDGTADAIFMMALFAGGNSKRIEQKTNLRFSYEQGAIVRGAKTEKKLALVFTGDEYADGAEIIAQTLQDQKIKASFFFTGRFYRNSSFADSIKKLKADGHYLGAHSDAHLLYNDWDDRNKLLVTKEEFEQDLMKNYEAISKFGIKKTDAKFFMPPYEWYNRTITNWTSALDLQLINFTPGTSSNADYTTPEMKNYRSSEEIFQRIKDYEAKNIVGLNGFILLLHIGTASERNDKFYNRLNELIDLLKSKKYEFVTVNELLK